MTNMNDSLWADEAGVVRWMFLLWHSRFAGNDLILPAPTMDSLYSTKPMESYDCGSRSGLRRSSVRRPGRGPRRFVIGFLRRSGVRRRVVSRWSAFSRLSDMGTTTSQSKARSVLAARFCS